MNKKIQIGDSIEIEYDIDGEKFVGGHIGRTEGKHQNGKEIKIAYVKPIKID